MTSLLSFMVNAFARSADDAMTCIAIANEIGHELIDAAPGNHEVARLVGDLFGELERAATALHADGDDDVAA